MNTLSGVKSAHASEDASALLHQPVSVLVGIGVGGSAVLRKLGIQTVFDLAASTVFNACLRLARPGPALKRLIQQGHVPNELVAAPARDDRELASVELARLRGLSAALVQDIEQQLGARTLGDLAAWGPFEAARRLAGFDEQHAIADPEVPDELVPKFNEHATEKSFYAVYTVDPARRTGGQELDRAIDMADLHREPGGKQVPRTGHVLRYEQSWTPVALTLGNLLHSLALAPGESTRVAIVDWSRRQGVRTTEDVSQLETLSNTMLQARAVSEITRAVAREAQGGFSAMNANSTVSNSAYSGYGLQNAEATMNAAMSGAAAGAFSGAVGGGVAGAGIGAIVGGVAGSGPFSVEGAVIGAVAGGAIGVGAGGLIGATAGGAGGFLATADFGSTAETASNNLLDVVTTTSSTGSRDLAAEMAQNIQDRTQQHSSTARNRRASIVQEIAQSETEKVSTRVVTNYNHMHALTVQYFEVVQLYAVQTRLVAEQRCLYVPVQPVQRWTVELVRLWREQILAAALTPEVAHALLAAERTVLLESPTYRLVPESARTASGRDALRRARALLDTFVSADPYNGWRLPERLRVSWVNVGIMADGPESQLRKEWTIHLRSGTHVDNDYGFFEGGNTIALGDISSIELRISSSTRKLAEDYAAPGGYGGISLACRLADAGARSDEDELINVPLLYARTASHVDGDGVMQVEVLRVSKVAAMAEVIEHLNENTSHYTMHILRSRRNPLLRKLLESFTIDGEPMANLVDPDPVAVTGNDLVFMLRQERAQAGTAANRRPEFERIRRSEIVPVGTGGVFAEAVQGRANSAERLDISRFWNWQESPIPIVAPEIAPVQTGSRATAADVRPGGLDAPLAANITPAALPPPQGMGAIIGALSATLFRDMSGIAQTAQLGQLALEQAVQGAVAAGEQASEGLKQGLQYTKDVVGRIIDMNSGFANALLQAGLSAPAGAAARGAGQGMPTGSMGSLVDSGPSLIGALGNWAGRLDRDDAARALAAPQPARPGTAAPGGSGAAATVPPAASMQHKVLQSAAGLQTGYLVSADSQQLAPVEGSASNPPAPLQGELAPLLAVAGESDEGYEQALHKVIELAEQASLGNGNPWEIYSFAMPALQQAWNNAIDRNVLAVNGGDLSALARIEERLVEAEMLPALRGSTQADAVIARLDIALTFVDIAAPEFSDGAAAVTVSGRVLLRLPGATPVPAAAISVDAMADASVEGRVSVKTDDEGRFSITLTHGIPDPSFAGVHRFTGFHDLAVKLSAVAPVSVLVHAEHAVLIRGRLVVKLADATYTDDGSDALAGSVVLVPGARSVWMHFRATKGGQALPQHAIEGAPVLHGDGMIESYTRQTGSDGLVSVIYAPVAQGSSGVAYISATVATDDGQVSTGRADLQFG
ncbi:MAG: hypothetical protein LC119_00310 [Burkholderiales bacterium]|nr:hypothetical protein [Burkholderiales bacterium]